MKRKTYRIKEWMRDHGITVTGVALALSISKSIVSETLYGKRNHRAVLEHLRAAGCPVAWLALPEDMLGVAA